VRLSHNFTKNNKQMVILHDKLSQDLVLAVYDLLGELKWD
jgi:hypothetical protein